MLYTTPAVLKFVFFKFVALQLGALGKGWYGGNRLTGFLTISKKEHQVGIKFILRLLLELAFAQLPMQHLGIHTGHTEQIGLIPLIQYAKHAWS